MLLCQVLKRQEPGEKDGKEGEGKEVTSKKKKKKDDKEIDLNLIQPPEDDPDHLTQKLGKNDQQMIQYEKLERFADEMLFRMSIQALNMEYLVYRKVSGGVVFYERPGQMRILVIGEDFVDAGNPWGKTVTRGEM